MNVSVLVGTFGSDEWCERGADAAEAAGDHPVAEVLVYHSTIGLAHARNHLAASATSEWLCFLDADDCLMDGYFPAMSRAACALASTAVMGGDKVHELALLSPAVQYRNTQGFCVGVPLLPNRQHRMEDVNHCVIGTLVQRELFHAVGGFDPDLEVYEDWALSLACIRAGARIVDVPEAIYVATTAADGRNLRSPEANQRTYDVIREDHQRRLKGQT